MNRAGSERVEAAMFLYKPIKLCRFKFLFDIGDSDEAAAVQPVTVSESSVFPMVAKVGTSPGLRRQDQDWV